MVVLCIGLITPAHAIAGVDSVASDHSVRIIMADDRMIPYYLICDVAPSIENGHTFVPLRAIAEEVGYVVEWNDTLKSVSLNHMDRTIELKVGSTVAEVNGESKLMSIAPKIVDDRMMIPLRFVSEQFGQYVKWLQNESTGITYIWITHVELLSSSDFENIAQDYTQHYPDDGYPEPYYVLKEASKTSRGILIGSFENDVIIAYGTPHKIRQNYGITQEYVYYGFVIPYSGVSEGMTFYFEDDKVVNVKVFSTF
jgi:hypothetical protein